MSTVTIHRISAAELIGRLAAGAGVELIDVRTPAEYDAVHVAGAKLVPLDRLDCAAVMSSRASCDGPVYLICKSGARAAKAAQKFAEAGHADVCVVEGGTDAWGAAGGPVTRGISKVISLERQVRIAAGLLVLVATVCAALISPWFLLLAGFVGAGLVFAGVTDFCGMGLLLARAPWNRRCGGTAGCCDSVAGGKP